MPPATAPAASLRIAIVGYGRMGRAVDALAAEHGCEVVARLDVDDNRNGEGIDSPALDGAEVAVEFSLADAVATNVTRLAARGIDVVVGTTGWDAQVAEVRRAAVRR